MDSKKTNLTPELKEIYDRVMNTSGTPPKAAPVANASPVTSPLPPTPSPLDAQIPTAPIPLTQSPPNPLNPPVLPNSPIPPLATPLPAAEAPPTTETPQLPSMPAMPSPAEQALSNTPARPISEGNTFAFNGTAKNKENTPTDEPKTDPTQKKKKKISMPILIVLGIAFIAVWGVFWAIILGFVPKP